MAMQCWLCPGIFASRKDLKNHVAGSMHFRFRVICPWCVDSEKISNRVGDLKKHINQKHQGLIGTLSPTYFSEASGFYLSLFPADYGRLITPAPPSSPDAISIKNTVRLWHPLVKGPSQTLLKWENGWAQGGSTPLHTEGLLSPRQASLPPSRDILYSPTRPELSIELGKLTETENGCVVPIKYRTEHYTVVLSSSLGANIKDRLLRHASNIDSRTGGIDLTGAEFGDIAHEISESLGFSECFIDSIKKHVKAATLPFPFPTFNSSPVTCTNTELTTIEISQKPSLVSNAEEVLNFGAMPLLAPARRNWECENVVDFHGKVNVVSWPPLGWKQMDAQRKTQVAEHAANLLDSDLSGFPTTPREDIMDRYNFLVLPGSLATPFTRMTERQKMRLLNYSQVRQVALGKSKDSDIVKMFKSMPPSATHKFINIINEAEVKLRL